MRGAVIGLMRSAAAAALGSINRGRRGWLNSRAKSFSTAKRSAKSTCSSPAAGRRSGRHAAAAPPGRPRLLAEQNNCLGGMGTAGMLPLFMPFTDGVRNLAGGIGEEIQRRLQSSGGNGPGSNVTIRAEVLKRVYDDLLLEANVDFSFHTSLIAVESDAERVSAAILAGKSGLFAVKARTFLDCTGDGDLAAWAGAPFEKGDEHGNMMAGTLCSLWADIDWAAAYQDGRPSDESRLEDAFRDKVFTFEDRHLPGMFRLGEHTGGGNIGHTFGLDSTDERSITKALLWARRSLPEYERYYKNTSRASNNGAGRDLRNSIPREPNPWRLCLEPGRLQVAGCLPGRDRTL